MNIKKLPFIAGLILSASSPAFASSISYDLTIIGAGRAEGINDKGQAIGSTSGGVFVWDKKNGMQVISDLPGSPSPCPCTVVRDLNNNGVIAGAAAADDFGRLQAFTWDRKAGKIELGTLGGNHSFAADINNSGQVVGESPKESDFSFPGANGLPHAFVWDKKSGMTDIHSLGLSSGASANNKKGQVVGTYGGPDLPTRSFIWEASSGMQDLGLQNLGFGEYSAADDINDLGQIAGVIWDGQEPAAKPYFMDSTEVVLLGSLEEGKGGAARGINNQGAVVGWSGITPWELPGFGNASAHAFIWDKDSGISDLNTLIDSDEIELYEATDINNSGQIVGWGYKTGTGGELAFILSPRRSSHQVPESGTVLMLGLSLAGISLFRRHLKS